MTSRTRTLLVAFALLGLGAASASAYVHYRLVPDPSYSSACDINVLKTYCMPNRLRRRMPVGAGGGSPSQSETMMRPQASSISAQRCSG